MVATEYIASAFVLVAASFIFIDVGFRIERKLDSDSIIDFFDAIRFFFFAIGFLFLLLSLNFGNALVNGSVPNMSSIFDTTIIVYTLGMSILFILGLAYFFLIIPRSLKKMKIERQRADEGDDSVRIGRF